MTPEPVTWLNGQRPTMRLRVAVGRIKGGVWSVQSYMPIVRTAA